jgi:lysyl-tRNA synthetase class 2
MLQDIIKERQKKLAKLKDKGINPYPAAVKRTALIGEVLENFNRWQKSGKILFLTGRLRAWRDQGKIIFGGLEDASGRLQLVFNGKQTKKFDLIKETFDSGDFVEAGGKLFKTQRGEKSLSVNSARIISKSLRPLPTEWFGLKDVEERFRQRYLDLIMNPEVKEVFLKRQKIFDAIREFLTSQGFLEVQTPILQPIYGGTNARPFESKLNALDMKVYMRISNEMYLKRLIVGGYEKIFEFSPDFRNEGIDKLHNPEFTQIETMWAYADYEDNMKLWPELVEYVVKKLYGKTKIKVGDKEIDFKAPWKRLKFNASGIKNFEESVQPKIIQPTLVYDFPKESVALAKSEDGKFAKSFEVIINGWEIALCYCEENNPEALKNKWLEQEKELKKGDQEAQRMDLDFINALEIGMPPTSGVGMGIDRLVMLLTNSSSIRDVIFFPFMRPK